VWNVLHTNPNCESQVAKYLALHEIEVYAPEFSAPPGTRPGSVRDRRHRRLFPGYLFFKVAPGFHSWNLVHWAPGVRRVLTDDGMPSLVSQSVIDRIGERLAQPQRPLPFRKGQPVLIQGGPLAMVDAIFDRELNTSERVQVLVTLLGRPMTVAIDAAMLRAG
jgi:transcription antitermination factor NusG